MDVPMVQPAPPAPATATPVAAANSNATKVTDHSFGLELQRQLATNQAGDAKSPRSGKGESRRETKTRKDSDTGKSASPVWSAAPATEGLNQAIAPSKPTTHPQPSTGTRGPETDSAHRAGTSPVPDLGKLLPDQVKAGEGGTLTASQAPEPSKAAEAAEASGSEATSKHTDSDPLPAQVGKGEIQRGDSGIPEAGAESPQTKRPEPSAALPPQASLGGLENRPQVLQRPVAETRRPPSQTREKDSAQKQSDAVEKPPGQNAASTDSLKGFDSARVSVAVSASVASTTQGAETPRQNSDPARNPHTVDTKSATKAHNEPGTPSGRSVDGKNQPAKNPVQNPSQGFAAKVQDGPDKLESEGKVLDPEKSSSTDSGAHQTASPDLDNAARQGTTPPQAGDRLPRLAADSQNTPAGNTQPTPASDRPPEKSADGNEASTLNEHVNTKQASAVGESMLDPHASQLLATSHAARGLEAPPSGSQSNQAPPHFTTDPGNQLKVWETFQGNVGRIVNSAWLNAAASHSEMHVELLSASLGPLTVHTILRGEAVGAEIHVGNHQAHTLLAAELPSLERALGDRNLHLENISIRQDAFSGGMTNGGGGRNSQSHVPTPPDSTLPRWAAGRQPSFETTRPMEGVETSYLEGRLSVRA